MKQLLTEEQKQRRAETARRNGAKSKGPVTAEGKRRSSMNAITVGEFVDVLEEELPPSARLLSVEDRKAYIRLHQANLRHFRPQSEAELTLLRNITIEQFEYERFRNIETVHFQMEHEEALERWPDLPKEHLSAYAIDRSVVNHKIHRFIERKMKGHLAAWTRFVALFGKLRKAAPVEFTENEPIPGEVEKPTNPIPNQRVTASTQPCRQIVEMQPRQSEPTGLPAENQPSQRGGDPGIGRTHRPNRN